MAPARSQKPPKIFHPSSRKAHQLARNALRKGKLVDTGTRRVQKHDALVDVYGFFFHATPHQGTLTLRELHDLTRNVWLTRHNTQLEQERATRRKGRPKSAKESRLEDIIHTETQEYQTGLEIIDLTHPVNVQLFRQWDQKELAYVQQLRHIRISSKHPDLAVLSRPGQHKSLIDCTPDAVDEPMT